MTESAATATTMMTASAPEFAVETDPLVKHNLETRQELELWIKAQKSTWVQTQHQQQTAMQDTRRQRSEAERRRETLQEECRNLNASIHDQEGKVSLQQVEIEVLQAEQSKKEPVLKELFETNHSKDDELARLVADSSSQRSSMLAQLTELQRGIAKYNRMGLLVEQVGPQSIRICFTKINPANPQQEFSFGLNMDPVTEALQVDACNPPVEMMESLQDYLTQTGDFAFFVRAMRREFKKLV